MDLLRNSWARLILVLSIGVLALAACSASSASPPAVFSSGAAHSAADSALANPQVSTDLSTAETELLGNLQAHFDPAHPVKSVQTAVQLTFPQGNTHKTEAFAVKSFTPAVLTTKGPGSARDKWLQGVVHYAETQGLQPAAGSPGASSPSATAGGA
jgi:hypothetical protein